jgi:thioredoxin reductase
MTNTMELPLHGRVKLFETSKTELLKLWTHVIDKNEIQILENKKVESISKEQDIFKVGIANGETLTAKFVLLAIGRRGSPRKLGIPGENLEKVAYRLLDAEIIENKNIVVVGGGDSAIESALLLADKNKVLLSYRGDTFSRIKPKNRENIEAAVSQGKIDLRLNTKLSEIRNEDIILNTTPEESEKIANDLVYIFAGGELPTQFLEKIGIRITKKFGEAILKH